MKRILCVALALGVLASCSKTNEGPVPKPTPEEGVATRALFTITQPVTPATRATAPVDEGKKEGLIKSATVYVFNQQKNLENIVVFTSEEIAASPVSPKKEITTTTGQHYFLASINAPAGIPAIALGENLAVVEKKLLTVTDLTLIAKPGEQFFMTNIEGPTSAVLESGGSPGSVVNANKILLKIGRAMAKVQVNIPAEVSQPNGQLRSSDAEYMVVGNPNKMYLFPSYEDGQLVTPYYNDLFTLPASAANYFPKIEAGDGYTEVQPKLFAMGTATYAMENSNKEPKFGEATYVMITGIYKPNQWFNADGTENLTPATFGNDFWRIGVKNAKGRVESFISRIFSGELSQTDIDRETSTVSDPNYVLVKYTGGRTYYPLWLADNTIVNNPKGKYTVPRNTFFNVSIHEITGPGYEKPDLIPDPELPIEVTAYIQADIMVLPWNLIEQGGVIGN